MTTTDFAPLQKALRTCFTAVSLPVPDMVVEDDENLVLKGTGFTVWQEARIPKGMATGIVMWVVGATVVTLATRYQPEDADVAEIGAYRTASDAAINLVLAMLKDRMDNALQADAEADDIDEARRYNDPVASMQADIKAGVPREIVLAHARRHIVALRDLLQKAKDNHQTFHDAIQATVQFIMSNGDSEYMERNDFAAKAKQVVEKAGERHHDGFRYVDDQIEIGTGHNGLDLQVSWVVNHNPVTMVSKGEVIRHHGEHTFLTKHLNHLVETLL